MLRSCIALLATVSGLILQAEDSARTAAPSYSATLIVNSATKTPGPLAPNSLATILGKDLTFVTEEAGHVDRNELAGARVLVRGGTGSITEGFAHTDRFCCAQLVAAG